MVNNSVPRGRLGSGATALVVVYVVVVVGTLAALAVLTAMRSPAATVEAWVHAAIVGVLGILLPLRLRSARRGSASATRAVAIISGVLLAVNVVEAALPGLFPVWMRIEMVGIAALMAAVLVLTIRALRSGRGRGGARASMMGA